MNQSLEPIVARAELSIIRTEDDFKRKISRFVQSFGSKAPFKWEAQGAGQAYKMLNAVQEEMRELVEGVHKIQQEQHLFGLKKLSLEPVENCQSQLVPLKHVWDIAALALAQMQWWRRTVLSNLDLDTISAVGKSFVKQIENLTDADASWPIIGELTAHLTKFIKSLPMVDQLRSSSLRPRHWKVCIHLSVFNL